VDSVFLDLFGNKGNKKYLLQLYQTLHPEDANATEEDLKIVTIENILTDNAYNDLGFTARGDRLLLLVEAQSTWTSNILVRVFLYLAQTYHDYCIETKQDMYKGKKVEIPKPELFVVFTGERADKPEVLCLSEEFFHGEDTAVEVKAKLIYYEPKREDILNQYIIFCKVFDDQRKKYGLTTEAVEETIRICKDRNVLREYLESKEKEVITIMMDLFNKEQIMKMYTEGIKREAAEEAEEKAKEKAAKAAEETARRMFGIGMSVDDVAKCLPALSSEALRKIEAEVMKLA
jgi:hypothetical protein